MVKLESHIVKLRQGLLNWYDESGRTLPWRIRPEDRAQGVQPDPYAVWLSEIMLQQTTVPHATPYWEKFVKRWPSVSDLAAATQNEVLSMWAGLGYYARGRNLHKCAHIVDTVYEGQFPTSEKELLKLPGIGPYTAATMAAICFNEPTNIVDGNVERVIARLNAVDAPLPKSKKLLASLAAPIADPDRPGDYGQALMDLGATVCTPKNPKCETCVWHFACQAHKDGNPTDYPVKTKKDRPVKYGAVFALIKEDQILMRRRPDAGLLGGMLEVPGTPWKMTLVTDVMAHAPAARNWEKLDGEVKHIFTHFELRLDVYRAEGDAEGMWVALDEIGERAVPTVMKKVVGLLD